MGTGSTPWARRWGSVACALVFLAAACTTPSHSPTATPAPNATVSISPSATAGPPPAAVTASLTPTAVVERLPGPAPKADPFRLAKDLRKLAVAPLSPSKTEYSVGRVDAFHIMDFNFRKVSTINADLRLVSPTAYFYVEQGLNTSKDGLESAATELETRIIPAVRRYINPSWDPGAGIDSRISIVHTRVAGAAGYVSSQDLLPSAIYGYSNQRPTVFMSLLAASPGTGAYYQVLAHEVQHLANQQANAHQATWLQEGASELFSDLAGYRVSSQRGFLANPDVDLINWDTPDSDHGLHYGAAYLFLKYLGGQVGYEKLPALIAGPSTGMDAVANLLKQAGDLRTPSEAVRDWTVANIMGGETRAGQDRRFTYAAPSPGTARAGDGPPGTGPQRESVAQNAARYAQLDALPSSRLLTFDGAATTPLLPTVPPSGRHMWWSNRGEHIAASMGRDFDLTGVKKATLLFKVWYDIEEQFDFCYVLASRDKGATWDILTGGSTTNRNDLGQSFGQAYTGATGQPASWTDESMDLTPYAGGHVLIRFLYVTDEGINNRGLALDDIAVPELQFKDDAEGEDSWMLEGFARIDNAVPQEWFLTIVYKQTGEAVTVPLDGKGHGSTVIPPDRTAVLVITAAAPLTSVRADYTYSITPTG